MAQAPVGIPDDGIADRLEGPEVPADSLAP
jgi:hypothetical protein